MREEAWSKLNRAKAPAWREYAAVEEIADEARDRAIAEAVAGYKRETGEDYLP